MRLKDNFVPVSLAVLVLLYPLKGGDTLALGFLPTGVVLALVTLALFIRPWKRVRLAASDLLVYAYTGLVIASAASPEAGDFGPRYLVQILSLSIYPYLVIRLTGLSLEEASRFLAIFPWMTLLAAGSMITILGPQQLLSYSGYRLGSDALNPVGVGYAFGMAALLIIAAICARQTGYTIGLLSLAVSVVLLVLSASRASMLALAAGAIILITLGFGFNRRTMLVIGAMVAGGLVTFSTLPSIMVSDRFLNALESASAQARYNSWSEAWTMFGDRPVFGFGLGSFENLHGEYVHNIVLEHLANGGLLMATPFLLLVAFFALPLLRRSRRPVHLLVLFFSVLGIYAFTVRFFSLSMANTKEIFLFLAMALSCRQSARTVQHDASPWPSESGGIRPPCKDHPETDRPPCAWGQSRMTA